MKKRIILTIIVLLLIVMQCGCDHASDNSEPTKEVNFVGMNSSQDNSQLEETEEATQTEDTDAITEDLPEYIADELLFDLRNNALRAEMTYQDQCMLLTGIISGFDSDGAYFSIRGMQDEYMWDSIECMLTSEEQLATLIEKNLGDVITIRCRVTIIGEIVGYTVDVIEFVDIPHVDIEYPTEEEDQNEVGDIQTDEMTRVEDENDEHIGYLQGKYVAFLEDDAELFITISAYKEDYGEISYYMDYQTGGVELDDILYSYDECYGSQHSIMFDVGMYYPEHEGMVEILFDDDFGWSICADIQDCEDTYGDYYELIPMP